MSTTLRVMIAVVSLLFGTYTIRKMRRSQMLIADSIFWIVSAIGLITLSVLPQIAINISMLLGINSPANFVFLVVLFIILIKLFSISIDISITKQKLKSLTEEYAIHEYMKDKEFRCKVKYDSSVKNPNLKNCEKHAKNTD